MSRQGKKNGDAIFYLSHSKTVRDSDKFSHLPLLPPKLKPLLLVFICLEFKNQHPFNSLFKPS